MQEIPQDLLKEYVWSQQFSSTAGIMPTMKEMFRGVIERVMEVPVSKAGRPLCSKQR